VWKSFHSVETCRFYRKTVALNFHTLGAPTTHDGACVEIVFRPVCLGVFRPISATAGARFSFQLPPGRGPLLGGITGRRPRSGRLGQNKKAAWDGVPSQAAFWRLQIVYNSLIFKSNLLEKLETFCLISSG